MLLIVIFVVVCIFLMCIVVLCCYYSNKNRKYKFTDADDVAYSDTTVEVSEKTVSTINSKMDINLLNKDLENGIIRSTKMNMLVSS